MVEVSQKQNILFHYLGWQFFEMPENILSGWENFLRFNLNYFSIPLLLKTFFSPWRRYYWIYPKGFDIAIYFEVIISNLISRVLGAFMRTVLITIGILAEIFLFFAGLIIFIGWLLLPFLLLVGFLFGIRFFF